MTPRIRYAPLTAKRWPDLERLFGERGACGGCWCMWWRIPRSQWTRQKGAANRAAFRDVVRSGEPAGILAYEGREPVAWCAVAPREAYPVLARSRALKPIDGEPVWSVTCFFVPRHMRGKGLSVGLLAAARDYVRAKGGRLLEGYPVEPRKGRMPDAFAWTGVASAFRKAGFKEAARRGSRPIMRLELA